MATAFIHSGNGHYYELCKAYFEVYGHAVTDTGPVDVAIVDLDYGTPPAVEANILIYLSCRDYRPGELPEHTLFQLKPVEVDVLMDRILEMLEQTV